MCLVTWFEGQFFLVQGQFALRRQQRDAHGRKLLHDWTNVEYGCRSNRNIAFKIGRAIRVCK